jgi:DNA polymerase III delta prime subunit
VRWIDLPPGCGADAFERLFGAATGSSVAAFADSKAAQIVIVDQADDMYADARELLRRAVQNGPETTRFVVTARGESIRDVVGPFGRISDPALFRFDAGELQRLCEANGVTFAPAEIELALQMTNGWATALADTVRSARPGPLPLADAVKDWRSGGGVVVQSIVERMLEVAAPHDAALLTTVLAEPQRATPAQLTELAGRGLFVDVVEGRPQLNPVVAAGGRDVARARLRRDDAPAGDSAVLTLFGSFRMKVHGTEVRFSRRRDRQIIAYLALAPDGRATRAELFDAFWPRADRDSRSQGLRTACSMIRSAIARCAGREHVDRYFCVADGWVSLNLEHVTCDLYAFEAEIARAAEAELAGDSQRARSAWAAAVALCVAPLLEDEPQAAWIDRRAELVDAAAARARRCSGAAAPRRSEQFSMRLVSGR